VSPAVEAAVRRLLPSPSATAALQAALWNGDEGRAAFDRWVALVGDPRALPEGERQPLRELAPQLDGARSRHGARAAGALGVLLHAAADHERRRWAPFRDAAVDLLGDEADPLLSGGLATAFAAYPEPAVRHCHDLDRLGPGPTYVEHPSGLPTVVHLGLLPPDWGATEDLEAVQARAVPDDRLGRPAHRVGVGDLLVTVLVHHVAGRRFGSVRWASDVWLLAAAATDADWQVFTDAVGEFRVGPVVQASLEFVAGELAGDVPSSVLDDVAGSPSPDPRQAALALRWVERHKPPQRGRRVVRAVRRRLVR
jgi:hypothetical protein